MKKNELAGQAPRRGCYTSALTTLGLLSSLGAATPSYAQSTAPAATTSGASSPIDCGGSEEEQVLCGIVQNRVNEELAEHNLRLDRAGLLFNYDNPVPLPIDTGHGCSHRAQISRSRMSARLSSDIDLDLSGDLLDEPLVIAADVPVTLDARLDMLERFGVRVLGRCRQLGSDSYSASGSLDTRARVVVAFSLTPTRRFDADGNDIITLQPRVRVLSALEDTSVNFELSGVSPISAIAAVMLGVPGTVLRSAEAVFSQDSVSEVWRNAAVGDFLLPVVTTLGTLPEPLQDQVLGLLEDRAEAELTRAAHGFGPDVEDTLTAQLRAALRLDAAGERTFVVPPDFRTAP